MTKDIFEIISSLELGDEKTIFEIGAADGEDSLRIIDAFKFSHGRYFVIEPEPANLRVLVQRPQMLHDGVMILPIAIGDRNALVNFNRSSAPQLSTIRPHTFSGSVKKPTRHLDVYKWCKFESTIPVQMVRLDDLTRILAVDRIDFIWCDIQGTEDLMLSGAQETLSRTSYLYTEYSEDGLYEGQIGADEIGNRLPGKWEIVEKWPNDILFKRLDKSRAGA